MSIALVESGNSVKVFKEDWLAFRLIDLLKLDAARALPPLTRYEIRRALPKSTSALEEIQIAWYSSNRMQAAEPWGGEPSGPKLGYILYQQCVTPAWVEPREETTTRTAS